MRTNTRIKLIMQSNYDTQGTKHANEIDSTTQKLVLQISAAFPLVLPVKTYNEHRHAHEHTHKLNDSLNTTLKAQNTQMRSRALPSKHFGKLALVSQIVDTMGCWQVGRTCAVQVKEGHGTQTSRN